MRRSGSQSTFYCALGAAAGYTEDTGSETYRLFDRELRLVPRFGIDLRRGAIIAPEGSKVRLPSPAFEGAPSARSLSQGEIEAVYGTVVRKLRDAAMTREGAAPMHAGAPTAEDAMGLLSEAVVESVLRENPGSWKLWQNYHPRGPVDV